MSYIMLYTNKGRFASPAWQRDGVLLINITSYFIHLFVLFTKL
jgi:hypothetical protein